MKEFIIILVCVTSFTGAVYNRLIQIEQDRRMDALRSLYSNSLKTDENLHSLANLNTDMIKDLFILIKITNKQVEELKDIEKGKGDYAATLHHP